MFKLINIAPEACQVSPTEYAYHSSSVAKVERIRANCRNYPTNLHIGAGMASQYIHCDGTQLRLSDSDLGPEQYDSNAHYVWPRGTRLSQLLFIFSTTVTMTTITPHYYSDSNHGLPRLRFYAVPDDFDIWNAPLASYRSAEVAEVAPGGESAGRRNVSINVNFNTKKVLMYMSSLSLFQFAVSEVEFFTCDSKYNSH